MSEIPDGKYLITSFLDPQPWVGADNDDDCAVKPVIIDGEMRKWSITDGKLVLEDNWYASADSKSVVVQTSVDPGTRWNFLRVDNGEPGWYLIRLANTNIAWTASNTKPKTRVTLAVIPDGPINFSQVWKFTMIPE